MTTPGVGPVVATDLSCHRRRALGANPVTINFDQALIAFQQGTVDGQENPIALIVPYKLWEVVWNGGCPPLGSRA